MASPITRVKVGGVSVSVFANPGTRGIMYSAQVQRAYFDKKTQKVAYTQGLNINDIPKAILALQKVYEWLVTGGPEQLDKEPRKEAGTATTASEDALLEEDTPF